MTPIRVFVCGRLAIETADSVVLESTFPARQGRRLWAYLVLNRRFPVSRDDLAAAIWDDAVPDARDAALNALISRLRALLKPVAAATPGIAIEGDVGRYRLHLPRESFVDIERARLALHTAEAKMRTGEVDIALPEARVAMEIAGRGFLNGENASWIEGQRRSLRNLQLRALECTIECELARGNARLAEDEAALLVTIEPVHERGYQLRMRAAAANGDISAVTRMMTECRAVLREQAGLTPSPETERIYRALLNRRS